MKDYECAAMRYRGTFSLNVMKKLLYFSILGTALTCFSCGGDGKNASTDASGDSLAEAEVLTDSDSIRQLVAYQDTVAVFLKSFYEEFVFGEDEVTQHVAESYFTPALNQKLSEHYDYEGEGYAVWELRSGAQDGPSRTSKVVAVVPLSRTQYRVDFIDMGISGQKLITIADSPNEILIENYEDLPQK